MLRYNEIDMYFLYLFDLNVKKIVNKTEPAWLRSSVFYYSTD